jgi:hypothetical protein
MTAQLRPHSRAHQLDKSRDSHIERYPLPPYSPNGAAAVPIWSCGDEIPGRAKCDNQLQGELLTFLARELTFKSARWVRAEYASLIQLRSE